MGYLRYLGQFRRFRSQDDGRFLFKWSDRYPCLEDATGTTGFDRHYVYHPAWAARRIAEAGPALHVDISSSLYFVSVLSAHIPVRFLDYRPAGLNLSHLDEQSCDLNCLPFQDNEVQSLSCMHVVEHIGLGRYGDTIDPAGDLKAIEELKRVLARGGDLYFVVPVGAKARIQFNAHRVYEHSQVLEMFSDLELKDFSLIPDDPADGGLVPNPSEALLYRQTYGCGCYHFRKRARS